MAVSYNKLWKIMIDKKISKTEMTHLAGISTNAMAKLGRDEDVRVNILEKICTALDCTFDDIVEIVPDKRNDWGNETIFAKLSGYPNIRQKIYKLYTLKNEKQKLYKVCEKYARRLKWHIYRLYRVRNGIVHAGQENKDIQVLGEHLHIYCDGVILEIITKLASSVYLTKINDVLLDTKLLVETKKERFSNNESITYDDIEFLLKRSFV